MTAPCRDLFEGQNSATAKDGGKSAIFGVKPAAYAGYHRRLHSALRAIWPFKLTRHLLVLVPDLSLRQAERIAAGERASADVVVGLLWSEHGYRILSAIMDGCPAEWWRQVVHEHEVAAAKRERRELERRIKRLEEES
jgi:hypothetical protein